MIAGNGIYPATFAAAARRAGVERLAAAAFHDETEPSLEEAVDVLDWFREWMEYPPEARGLLTTGGSMATFAAIVSARDDRLGQKLRDGVLYASTQAHHSVAKAAHLLTDSLLWRHALGDVADPGLHAAVLSASTEGVHSRRDRAGQRR